MRLDRFALRSGAIRRSLALLIAVSAIVAGILGMHVLMAGSGIASNAHAAQSMSVGGDSHITELTANGHDGAATFAGSVSSGAADCLAGSCDPVHDVMAMICLLALLVTALLLAPAIGRSRTTLFQDIVARAREFVSRVAPRSPPSLYALSISRT